MDPEYDGGDAFGQHAQSIIMRARRLSREGTSTLRRINQLTTEIRIHNQLYYGKAGPIIPDRAFDALLGALEAKEAQLPGILAKVKQGLQSLQRISLPMAKGAAIVAWHELVRLQDELEQYEQLKKHHALANSIGQYPAQQVGVVPTTLFPAAKHKFRMYSLANTYSLAELRAFDTRIHKQLGEVSLDYVCEQKFDGVAINLIYEKGCLTQAITRGDGVQGDLVTANVRTINELPQKIKSACPPYFEVRGEVFLSKKNFEALNDIRAETRQERYANPRNTVVGTLKLKDSGEVKSRKLSIYCYGLLSEERVSDTHLGCLSHLKTWKFPVSASYALCGTMEETEAYINHWKQERETLPVETDGVVIKVNQLDHQKNLGHTAKSPRWAVAYKYAPDIAATRLIGVTFQVGRTGVITPVAELEPVLLQNTIVARATLHNQGEMQRLGLKIGDKVHVEKGGDVIPKVLGVSSKGKNRKDASYPTHCPDCATALRHRAEEADHYCPNTQGCRAQILGRILHFISRKALNITFLGKENIRAFLDLGLIKDVADLYDLDAVQLRGLSINVAGDASKSRSLQQKSVQNILDGLATSRNVPFARVLFGLGIRHVGETLAQTLARHFGSIDQLQIATQESLLRIHDVGGQAADSIHTYFQNTENLSLIQRLKRAELQFETTISNVPQTLNGKKLVVSGTFRNYSRDSIRTRIRELGGELLTAPSRKTDYFVVGEKVGSSKQEKAEKFGITTISEEEFEALTGDSNESVEQA